MEKNPNPQGKGVVPALDCLAACRADARIPAKTIERIANELFTSLFVLHSEFSFQPVVEKTYSLYRRGERFRLSLIAPQEWGNDSFGQYVGECVLHHDMTWSLQSDARAGQDPELSTLIAARRAAFEQKLDGIETLHDILPVFDASLAFYQRVFAFGVAHSLAVSMRKAGLAGLSYTEARSLNVIDDS